MAGLFQRMTTEEFVEKARRIHGDRYDYSLVVYGKDNNVPVKIICKKHGVFEQTPRSHLSGKNCWRCRADLHKKALYGIAINDVDESVGKSGGWYYPWADMLERCYDEEFHKKTPSYIGCRVCDEWLFASNFKKWYDENYIDGYSIDKDILQKGNKLYSPDTCVFVPHRINTIILGGKRRRGDLPIGVYYSKSAKKYVAGYHRDGRRVYICSKNTPEEAFYAYKAAKESYIKEVAQEYFDKGLITEKVRNALFRYEVEITD